MIKLFLISLLLILSGSKQDSLSDMNTDEENKTVISNYPCSSELSKDKLLPNEEKNSQHSSNKQSEKDNAPTVFDCLVNIHEKNAIKSVTDTTKAANLNRQRSSYVIKTNDNFRDFTTKRNRSKISEEVTVYIDVAEKCNKINTRLPESKLDSGRRFNNIPNIGQLYKANQSKIDINSSSNSIVSNQIQIDSNSTSSQKNDEKLSVNKVSSIFPLGDHVRIISKKINGNGSNQEFVSSLTLNDKRNPKDELQYLELNNKEVTNKPSTEKFDLLSALNTSEVSNKIDNINQEVGDKPNKEYSRFDFTDGNIKGSFVLLDFSNKEIGDKPSLIKYDLKSAFKNKTSELPLSDNDINVKPYNKNYNKTHIPNKDIYKNILLHNGYFNSKEAVDKHLSRVDDPDPAENKFNIDKKYHNDYSIHNKVSAKPSANNKEQNTTPYNDNDLFTYFDLSNKELYDKETKQFSDHRRVLIEKKDSDKDLINNYEQTFTPTDNIKKDFVLHNNISKIPTNVNNFNRAVDHNREVTQKENGDEYTTYQIEQTSSAEKVTLMDLIPYYDLDNKKLGENINLSKVHYQDVAQKKDNDEPSSNKYDQSVTPYQNVHNYFSLQQGSNDKQNDRMKNKMNPYDLMYNLDDYKLSTSKSKQASTLYDDIAKDLLPHHNFTNKVLNKHVKVTEENHQGLHKVDSEKMYTNQYDQTLIRSDNFTKNLLAYHDLNNNETNDKNIKLLLKNYESLNKKENSHKPFTYKYIESSTEAGNIYNYFTSSHKNVNRTKGHQNVAHKENDDKHIIYKSEIEFTPDDNFIKDLLFFLSFENKALNDKHFKVFNDYYQEIKHNKTGDNVDKKYEKNNQNLMSEELINDLNYKKVNDKLSIEKDNSSNNLNDGINKNLLTFNDIGNKTVNKKNSSDMNDLQPILKNNIKYNENIQVLTYRKNDNKLFNNKYDENIKSNFYPYQGDGNKKIVSDKSPDKKYDLKFTVHNETSKENNLELNNKEIASSYSIKGSHIYETSKDELITTVDVEEPHLVEPTTGYSIKDLFKARVMLLESTRVCYACSSISDHSCWQPGRSTTVKYCRKGHNACLTKTFKTEESEFIVIRDCGTTCDGTWPVLDARYKSCSICHDDMCNDHLIDINNGHINSINFFYFVSLTVIIKLIV